MSWKAAVVLVALFAEVAAATQERPLLRFPDVHDEAVIFVHGEDIWRASITGGVAQRLTIHDGQERHPKFSNDGTLVAFTGEYDGNADVYVMGVYGGEITRVTFHPGADTVVGWHPKTGKILFRSARRAFSRFERLYLIAPDGSGLEELILHEAAFGSFSADGKQIAYNRVGRENRTWKRYRGGLAQDLWLFDFATKKDRRLTTFDGTDRTPMWIGDKIYFSSDRNRLLNIFAFDVSTGKIEQKTFAEEYDVRRPSSGGNQIVYEMGGELWLLDVATGENRSIPIRIETDAPERRPEIRDVTRDITQIAVSPKGNRALVVARGDLFSVPKKDGPTRNLTQSSGSRQQGAAWSPDGKTIAYLSDESGEYAIHLIDTLGKGPLGKGPLGKGQSVQLTHHDSGYRHTLRWSPDSEKIAFADQTLRFYYVDVETKEIVEVDRSAVEPVDVAIDLKPIHDYVWSPDSRFLAYSKIDADQVSRIYIYSLEAKKSHRVSGDLFNDFGPVFAENGKHLFFISNRRFDPTYCDVEWEMVYKKVAGLYALTLQKNGPSVLPLRSDEEVVGGKLSVSDGTDKTSGDVDGKAKGKKSVTPDGDTNVTIDFDGISARVEALPVGRGNYRKLSANRDRLFFLNAETGDFNRFEFRTVSAMDLSAFSFKDRKSHTVIKGVSTYYLSADGLSIVYRKGAHVGIIPAADTDSSGKSLQLTDLKIHLDPVAEWQQIFAEAWRLERDFYYDPNMHGLDWAAVKNKYGRLVPHASCRQDVSFIIGEMIGDLNTSHTYVHGGDYRRKGKPVNTGLLGVDWAIDSQAGRYRFSKILSVPDWTLGTVPPLARPGVDVRVGDYLLEVNGQDVTTARNVYSFFQGLAGKQVSLLVNGKPNRDGARQVTVVPIRSERTLRYRDWLEHNRSIVERQSKGLIGYLHLPDTYNGSAREFPKYFYSQTQKKGLIVDGRFNGGGLDPDIFLQRLDKHVLAFWTRRYSLDQTTPNVVTRAHMVLLTNRQAGSGGDMLPMEFQQKEMGPVIGTRTWGGLVGVSMSLPLIDGGSLTAPDYRIYSPEGKWVVENVGIQPDIVVDLTPEEMARGFDAQLQRGIDELMQAIERDPREKPSHPPVPVDH